MGVHVQNLLERITFCPAVELFSLRGTKLPAIEALLLTEFFRRVQVQIEVAEDLLCKKAVKFLHSVCFQFFTIFGAFFIEKVRLVFLFLIVVLRVVNVVDVVEVFVKRAEKGVVDVLKQEALIVLLNYEKRIVNQFSQIGELGFFRDGLTIFLMNFLSLVNQDYYTYDGLNGPGTNR